MSATHEPNEQDVRVSDPDLSRDTNEAITADLRDAVGADRVRLPEGAAPPPPSAGGRPSPLAGHRLTLGIAFLALTTVGAVVALTAGSWWYLVGAWAVHGLGTMLVAGGALARLTEVERPSERTRALMERDGVADPDARFNDLVAHYGAAREGGGASEVVAPGRNERTVTPEDDPGRSAVEQRTAITPTSEPTEPVGTGSPIGLLPLWVVAGMMVVSLAVPVATGIGAMWVLPAVVLPLGVGWLALQWRMGGDDEAGAARRVPAVIPLVVAGVALFAVLMVVLGTR